MQPGKCSWGEILKCHCSSSTGVGVSVKELDSVGWEVELGRNLEVPLLFEYRSWGLSEGAGQCGLGSGAGGKSWGLAEPRPQELESLLIDLGKPGFADRCRWTMVGLRACCLEVYAVRWKMAGLLWKYCF